MRQSNWYDCGPFIVADLVSLLTSGKPSALEQKDMRGWRAEMVKGESFFDSAIDGMTYVYLAKGETFHLSFLSFFRLYVRLFLNSFGIQASLIPVRPELGRSDHHLTLTCREAERRLVCKL